MITLAVCPVSRSTNSRAAAPSTHPSMLKSNNFNAMSFVTSRDQPSSVLKAITRPGWLNWPYNDSWLVGLSLCYLAPNATLCTKFV
jgi:hypothetical protein